MAESLAEVGEVGIGLIALDRSEVGRGLFEGTRALDLEDTSRLHRRCTIVFGAEKEHHMNAKQQISSFNFLRRFLSNGGVAAS